MPEVARFVDLFRPLTIGPLQLKNRIVMLPMGMRMDLKSEQWRVFLGKRAQGGAAAIIHGAIATDLLLRDECWGQVGAVAELIMALRRLVQDVHDAGAKIGVQLMQLNCYPQTIATASCWPATPVAPLPEGEWVAPSARVEPAPCVSPTGGAYSIHGGAPAGQTLRELTFREIEDIKDKFVMAAAAIKEAGFDFVEIHGAHGTLPCQFFSPVDNRRNDKYGGNLSRRMTFGLELVEGIRGIVGDFPIFYRIPGEENVAGGQTLADAIAFAEELERVGVDCLDVTVGVCSTRPYFDQSSPLQGRGEGVFVPLAQAIKQHVGVPVIGVGNIRTPDFAERILREAKVDLVGMGRQFVADPMWPRKVMEGRTTEIVACDSCQTLCWRGLHPVGRRQAILPPNPPFCKLNREAGREWEAASAGMGCVTGDRRIPPAIARSNGTEWDWPIC